jgi:hypothetical protein
MPWAKKKEMAVETEIEMAAAAAVVLMKDLAGAAVTGIVTTGNVIPDSGKEKKPADGNLPVKRFVKEFIIRA